jgi:hypothetical protein
MYNDLKADGMPQQDIMDLLRNLEDRQDASKKNKGAGLKH